MAIFLTYIFLKSPAWLRALSILAAIGLFLFACILTATTFQNATQRTAPAHAHTNRAH